MEKWLDDLSISYMNFEEDFANGYLLGKLLWKCNQLGDFAEFVNSSRASYMNLTKLQFALSKLQIVFDPHKLLNKEPGYVQRLLRKVHESLHRQSRHGMSPLSKTELFNKRTDKFAAEKLRQTHLVLEEHQMEENQRLKLRSDFRSTHLNTVRENKLFMEDWERQGRRNWRTNQLNKRRRKTKEAQLKEKLTNEIIRKEVSKRKAESLDMRRDIDEFEKNMVRLGIDHVEENQKKKRINLAAEAAFTMARCKENKKKNDLAVTQRAMRTQKLLEEERKTQRFEVLKQAGNWFGDIFVRTLDRKTNDTFKAILKYFRKTVEVNQSLMAIEDHSMHNFNRWNHIEESRLKRIDEQEKKRQREKFNKLMEFTQNVIEISKEKSERHYKDCKPLVDLMVDIVEQSEQVLLNTSKLPAKTWQDFITYFKEDKEEEDNPIQEEETVEESNFDIQDYLEGKGSWLRETVPNDYYLGDVIELIIHTSYPVERKYETPPGPHYLPLKVCLLGPPFSGKKTQAKKLTETFGVKTFEISTIMEAAQKTIDKLNEPEDNKKKKQTEEESPLFIAACRALTDRGSTGKASLFRARIRGVLGDTAPVEEEVKKPNKKNEEVKCQGLGLLGYPKTLDEAKALERELSGLIHPSDLPEPISSIKKKEALAFVKPTPKPPSELEVFKSFFDIVIWIDLDLETVLKRALNRKMDPAGNVYNMLFNPPPDNLLAKCKPIEKPTKEEVEAMFEEYELHKDELKNWFSEFGIKNWGWNTLLSIDGNPTADKVTESIMNTAKKYIELKKNPPPDNSENSLISFQGKTIQISKEDCLGLTEYWEKLKYNYRNGLGAALEEISFLEGELKEKLREKADDFLKFLGRSDDKKSIADSLAMKIERIQASDIEEAIYTMWSIIDQQKEESISHRQSLLESNDIVKDYKKIIRTTKKILIVELKKYIQAYNLIGRFQRLTNEEHFEDFKFPEITINWGKPLIENEDFPVLDILIHSVKSFIMTEEWISETNHVFLFRIDMVHQWAFKILSNYKSVNSQLFDTMDQWIVKLVAIENKRLNEFSRIIRTAFKTKEGFQYEYPDNMSALEELTNFEISF